MALAKQSDTIVNRVVGAECTGCLSCFTTLREEAPFPMVQPHQSGPVDRDDPESPIICRTCGIHPPSDRS